jgi:CheY-like chemotaxis protein
LSAAPQHDRLAGLLAAMRAFHAGDASARAPRNSQPGESAIVAELCTLFNAIAERTQALELEAARQRAWDEDPAERPTASPAIIPESDRAPAILVLESISAEPMRDAAESALRGLGGAWDQASVVRVDSAESVHDAVARHRVVSALIDSRAPLELLLAVVAALDATVPGVPLLCFAPDGDPAAFDKATAASRGRNRAEVVRSPAQAVERLTLHWLTQATAAPDPLAEPAESGYGPIRFEGEKVLVVDDDVRNVFAMVSALELYGLTALTADNGPEGIELLLRNPDISAVLMDLMMPGLDGYATTELIRSRPEFADLPIIAVTARAAPGDRERSLAAGTNEHVTKPVEVDHLLALIKRLIKRG